MSYGSLFILTIVVPFISVSVFVITYFYFKKIKGDDVLKFQQEQKAKDMLLNQLKDQIKEQTLLLEKMNKESEILRDRFRNTLQSIPPVTFPPITEQAFEQVLRQRREEAAREFAHNLTQPFCIQRVELQNLNIYQDLFWDLQPRVNVLLGQNGYGKTYLIRLLLSILQRDDTSRDFFRHVNPEAFTKIYVSRGDEDRLIHRSREGFIESIGKIPVLAIPDSRFVNKSRTQVEEPDDTKEHLREFAADHFLHQLPYDSIVQMLFYRLGLDYLRYGERFDSGLFHQYFGQF